MAATFQHEEIAPVPRGYKVRTKRQGTHEIRLAFPPGRRRKGAGVLVEILHPTGENPSCRLSNLVSERPKNPSSVYGMAASLGYPYLRGEGRVAKDGRTWLSRVTKKSDGSGTAIFVGWDAVTRKWIVEKESGADYERGPRIGRENPDYYEIVFRRPDHSTDTRIGPYSKADAEDLAVRFREGLAKEHGKRVAVKVRKAKKGLLERIFRNPDDGELADAESLYEEFHGRAPREILEMQESSETRGEYTALGDLIELTMIAPNRDHVLIKFKNDGVRVASSPNGEQLYFLGGNQDIAASLGMFGADEAKDLIDLGEAKQIVYEAAKWQTNFDPQEWKHDFGEESGVRPRVFFDQLKKRIFFAGGNYKVKRPGIVD